MTNLVEQVRRAGVVGAGGAGFPTYVKLQAPVDLYICNAAECEPLLCKDQELIRAHAAEVVDGLRLAMGAVGASRGVIAIKSKYHEAIEALRPHLGVDIDFHFFDNFYPAGDEYIIVYDVTGRLIPVGGLPKDVGCSVNNVETLINLSRAARGVPVTHTALTVAGAVHEPLSAVVPVGVTHREVLSLAGGPTVEEVALIDGGPMMGKVITDLDQPVTKTSGGYIVLPADHHLIRRATRPEPAKLSISLSACDQCSQCTQLCPRFLLGYAIEPHKVMRSLGFAGEQELSWGQLGLQCCECGLCSLYSCPEDLPVREMCVRAKQQHWQRQPKAPPLPSTGQAHPMRDHRRVPIPRLIERLGLTAWDVYAPMTTRQLEPTQVRIALKQHIGAPCVPTVQVGQAVHRGQEVGAPPADALGTSVHASIDGHVSHIDDTFIWIQR